MASPSRLSLCIINARVAANGQTSQNKTLPDVSEATIQADSSHLLVAKPSALRNIDSNSCYSSGAVTLNDTSCSKTPMQES